MTCSQCRHEFCWLCLGDYRKHKAETGSYLCGSFQDVVKIGRAEKGDLDKKALEGYILRKLEHYSGRFNEHLRSLKFAEQRKVQVQATVKTTLEMNPAFNPIDFNFLEEVADLVIKARRCVTYTYAIRFYLKGTLRQQFFDMIQNMLEMSLEALNKRNEERWEREYLEIDSLQQMSLGPKFYEYKRDVISLKDSVEKHFS